MTPILEMLLAMASILGTWVLLGATLVGLGLTFQRLFRVRAVETDRVLLAFWMGYALVVLFAQLWNFVLPVNTPTLLITLGAGLAGVAWHARPLAAWAGRVLDERGRGLVVLGVAALWLSNLALGPGDAHDSGLYHFGVIKWANEYPVVPGLANLNFALANNNSSLLVAAVLNHGPWTDRIEHFLNGMLVLALAAQVIAGAARLLRGAGRPADLFAIVLVVPIVMIMFSRQICSPTTDLPQAITTWVLVAAAITLLTRPDDDAHIRAYAVVAIATLAATTICLKLSAIVLSPLVAVVAGVAWLRRDRPAPGLRNAVVASSIAMVVLLMGPWIGRSVVMSGYLLHPSTRFAMPVEWRAEKAALDGLVDDIRDHSRGRLPLWISNRLRGSVLDWYVPLMDPPFDDYKDVEGLNWVRPWLFSLPASSLYEVVVPVTLTGLVWVLVGAVRREDTAPPMGALPWLYLPIGAGIAFWFAASPEPRYGYGVMWTLAATSTAIAIPRVLRLDVRSSIVKLVLALAVLAVPAVAYRATVIAIHLDGDPWQQIPFRRPGVDHGFHPLPVDPQTEIVETRWGVRLNRPIEPVTRCWRIELPCDSHWPALDPDLRARRPGDLGAGFVIDRSPQ
jgi:hypothetical protein